MDSTSYHSLRCFVYIALSCAISNLLREKVSGDSIKKNSMKRHRNRHFDRHCTTLDSKSLNSRKHIGVKFYDLCL